MTKAGSPTGRNRIRSRSLIQVFLQAGLLVIAVTVAIADSQDLSAPHVQVELVSERDAIAAGQDFWVGLHFRLEEGWHVYWSNPGDSGQPPSVQWELPAGFQAGPIVWPYPERLEHAPLVDYGYERDVLLMARIHSPGSAQIQGKVDLAANAKWLVCREICIPGKMRLSLTLPVQAAGKAPGPARNQLFETARRRLPRPLPANWRVAASSEKDRFDLSIETGKPEAQAVFFPLAAEQIENSAPQIVTATKQGTRISLRKSEHLLKAVTTLNGVVVFSSGRAFLIHAKVSAQHREGNPGGG
jgi:DsbC/DsbD-like thiol-disulfide interchange protein